MKIKSGAPRYHTTKDEEIKILKQKEYELGLELTRTKICNSDLKEALKNKEDEI